MTKKKDSPSKDIKFTTIEITEEDRQRLFSCAMKIKEMNNDKEPMLPFKIASFATDALENEVDFWSKQKAQVSNELCPAQVDFRGREFDAEGNQVSSKKLN